MIQNLNRLTAIATTVAAFGLSVASVPASAAMLSFNGSVDSGDLIGTTYNGTITYDAPSPSNPADADCYNPDILGGCPIEVNPLDVTFVDTNMNTASFNQNSGMDSPVVLYYDGMLLGLEFSVESAELGTVVFNFSFVPGFFDITEAYLTYDVVEHVGGTGGTGSAEFSEIPEPTTLLGTFTILGIGGYFKRKQRR